jgi:hypothetical protein
MLILPVDRILEKYYKVTKQTEMKRLIKVVKQIIVTIKNNVSSIIKSGK